MMNPGLLAGLQYIINASNLSSTTASDFVTVSTFLKSFIFDDSD